MIANWREINFRDSLSNIADVLIPDRVRLRERQAEIQAEVDSACEHLERELAVKRIILVDSSSWQGLSKQAFLEGNPQVCGFGRTKSGAIGDLMRKWGHKFRVEVRDLC